MSLSKISTTAMDVPSRVRSCDLQVMHQTIEEKTEEALKQFVRGVLVLFVSELVDGGLLHNLNILHTEKRIQSHDPSECFANIFHILAASEVSLTIDSTSKRFSLFDVKETWWIGHKAISDETYVKLLKLCKLRIDERIKKPVFLRREYTGACVTRIYHGFRFNHLLSHLLDAPGLIPGLQSSARGVLCEQYACICMMNYVLYTPVCSMEGETSARLTHVIPYIRTAVLRTTLRVHSESYQDTIGLQHENQERINGIAACLQHVNAFLDLPPIEMTNRIVSYATSLLRSRCARERLQTLAQIGLVDTRALRLCNVELPEDSKVPLSTN